MSLFDRLLGRTPTHSSVPPDTVLPTLPIGTRVYAVGDIHGRVDLLERLHQMIHEDAYQVQAPRNVVIYLGDYIDRGENSSGVIELLIKRPLPGFERVHLKGNHEAAMMRFLEDPDTGIDWMAFGGDATLASYRVQPPRRPGDPDGMLRAQVDLLQCLPPSHADFLAALSLSHIEGDFLFVHAGLRPGILLDQQTEEDLLWIRAPFLNSDADFGKLVVHGHTIDRDPVIRHNRIGIDTGAYRTNKLTCLVIQDERYGFLQT
jgi:serine/threonine protein phosphatase 1